ncbi:MAG: Nif3-like dinuclear metal center hexameric protein [Bacteroidales bacterium]|nr:Nif3-like dinuclear metal center hexameric protein [Bacteroidales bacterium]
MKIRDIIDVIEQFAPPVLQEAYDNSGLQVGDPEAGTGAVLVSLDITESVIAEAEETGCRLIVSHHPVIFKEVKSLTGRTETGRIVIRAIKSGVSLYSVHTNLDNIRGGVNDILCKKIGLTDCRILLPGKGLLKKLVTFCPESEAEKVREALFRAGAGHIGNYDSCSFSAHGQGTFRGSDETHPWVGIPGKLHYENEVRIETIYPLWVEGRVLDALFSSHPYEEVAYDIYSLENEFAGAGSGMTGLLAEEESEEGFLERIKTLSGAAVVRHSPLLHRKIRKVAVCGGSGSFLIGSAKRVGADVFVTGDIKYHDFYQAEGKILLADLGHYETEHFAKELIANVILKKFPNFAVRLAKNDVNPVRYL